MIRLSRETRFALVPPNAIQTPKPTNSWAGWPSTNLIVPQLKLRAVVEGEPDPITGYLVNIKTIDDVLREIITRRLIPVYDGAQTAETVLRLVCREWKAAWKHRSKLVRLSLVLSPFLNYSISLEPKMPENVVSVSQQFEFSAAHRLHCEELSAEENLAQFGKCNNPEGHGHNYVIDVSVSKEIDSDQSQVVVLHEFESTVKRLVIDRLDHKHLNKDVEYFSTVNPSVENIAIAIFEWLDGQLGGAKLDCVRVYETPKTWAEFSGRS
jgi:6-pyruvoyltetrahydropterin/6-carboxytetrahydropterin synthase